LGPPVVREFSDVVVSPDEDSIVTRTFMVVTLALLLLAAGSAWAGDSVLPLPPEDQQKITTELGTGIVGQALPSKPIEDTSTYLPLRERALTYHVTAGPNGGKTQRLGLSKARRSNGRSACHRAAESNGPVILGIAERRLHLCGHL
jgi:hypothetical protein